MPGVFSRQARARDMMMPVAIRVEIGEREFDRECLRATVRLFFDEIAEHNYEFEFIRIYNFEILRFD